VYVRVKLAANSAIVSTAVDHSQGITKKGATVTETFIPAPLRAAALNSASRSVFVTETVNCRPRPSEYMYIVEFD